jgi:hypothetical protein
LRLPARSQLRAIKAAARRLSQNLLWSGLSALFSFACSISQGFALAVIDRAFGAQIAVIARLKSAEGAFYTAWGNAPGKQRTRQSRAEGPFHTSFETVSKLPHSKPFVPLWRRIHMRVKELVRV